MNHRLAELMQQEATLLEIPAARVEETLAQGRGMRRSRRIRAGLATLALVAMFASGVAGILAAGHTKADPVHNPGDYGFWGAWAESGTLFVGGEPMTLEGGVVGIYQTSEGILARLYVERDNVGTTTFVLVRPDGSRQPTDLTIGAAIRVGTAPDQPYLGFSERRGDDIHLVAYDVAAGEVAASTTIPIPDAGVDAISGDRLYQSPGLILGPGVIWVRPQLVDVVYEWNLATGAVVEGAPPGFDQSVDSDLYTAVDGRRWTVRSRGSGEVVASGAVPPGVEADMARLSPSGAFLVIGQFGQPLAVVDTATGAELSLPPGTREFTFTSDDRMISPLHHGDGGWAGLRSCDLRSGDCETKMLASSTRGLLVGQDWF